MHLLDQTILIGHFLFLQVHDKYIDLVFEKICRKIVYRFLFPLSFKQTNFTYLQLTLCELCELDLLSRKFLIIYFFRVRGFLLEHYLLLDSS